jgi:hypothetical protein
LAELSAEVASTESVSRFLMSGKYFAATIGRVKPPAVMPQWSQDRNRFETSTQRTDGLRSDEIWALGYRYVEKNRRIKARGYCEASLVTAQASLHFDINGEPYPRHADIVGWPADEDARLMLATEIANGMTLEVDPRP